MSPSGQKRPKLPLLPAAKSTTEQRAKMCHNRTLVGRKRLRRAAVPLDGAVIFLSGVINLTPAQPARRDPLLGPTALGLTVSRSLLASVDEVIE
jgi:hypothetical protein